MATDTQYFDVTRAELARQAGLPPVHHALAEPDDKDARRPDPGLGPRSRRRASGETSPEGCLEEAADRSLIAALIAAPSAAQELRSVPPRSPVVSRILGLPHWLRQAVDHNDARPTESPVSRSRTQNNRWLLHPRLAGLATSPVPAATGEAKRPTLGRVTVSLR